MSSSEAKLTTLSTKTEEFAAESKKLQERAQLAEEEMTRGYTKLKYVSCLCAIWPAAQYMSVGAWTVCVWLGGGVAEQRR